MQSGVNSAKVKQEQEDLSLQVRPEQGFWSFREEGTSKDGDPFEACISFLCQWDNVSKKIFFLTPEFRNLLSRYQQGHKPPVHPGHSLSSGRVTDRTGL